MPSLGAVALKALSPRGWRARLMIFTFHRVLDTLDALYPDEPDAATFGRILDWISSACRVLPLGEAVSALENGSLPACAAAITFDDGYRNNLEIAKPCLVRAGLPATVFVAVEPVRSGIMWNDLIFEGVRRSRADPALDDLSLPPVRPVQDPDTAVRQLLDALKYRAPTERAAIADELYRRLAGEAPPRLMLTEDEVGRLRGDGIEIGAHTLTHPILRNLADAEAEREIAECRRHLADWTGAVPTFFAYPNGRRGIDYDARHVAMVRAAGFSAAVSTEWGAASARSSIWELPRFTPWERSREPFTRRLAKVCVGSYL
jgi:peptidoglycan/xylan/chitin deacetylase (PgdA/CDA1 family)